MADFKLDTSHARAEVDALIMTLKDLRKSMDGTSQELHRDLALLEIDLHNLQKTGKVSAESLDKINKSLKEMGVNAKLTTGAYSRLNTKLSEARTHARNMAVQYGATSKQAVQAARTAAMLEKRINAVNAAMSRQSVVSKNIMGLFRNIASFTGFLGLAGAAQMFSTLTSKIFETVRALDALKFSMEAVIDDEFELAHTTIWLRRITNAYGAELINTTERYIKFRAAAEAAGFTMKDTQDIFETVTKASGVLGLKTHELQGIYLALEQMISKGKVTTEELRRQLGERLPGAVDILAKSMNVTNEELGNMMKRGEVITREVLPGFAEEIKKQFGLDSFEAVETLNASVNKLENSFTNLIASIQGNDGGISKALIFITDIVTNQLEAVENLNIVLNEDSVPTWRKVTAVMSRISPIFADVNDAIADRVRAEEERNLLIGQAVKVTKEYNDELEIEINLLETTKVLRGLNNDEILAYIDNITNANKVAKQNNEFEEGTIGWLRQQIKLNKEKMEVLGMGDLAELRGLQAKNEEYEKLLKFLLGTVSAAKKARAVALEGEAFTEPLFGSIDYLEDLVQETEKLIKMQTNDATRAWYQDQLDFYKDQLDLLKGINKEVEILEKPDFVKALKGYEVLQHQMEKYGEEIQMVMEIVRGLGELTDAIFSRKIENIEAEIDAETKKYDIQSKLAEDDFQQQKRIEFEKFAVIEKLEAERVKMEQRKAKANKAFALFETVINTASAIVEALPNVPLAILTGVLGAAQAATILAQPIPQYKDGLEKAKGDHIAMINDGGEQEFVKRGGSILTTSTRNAIVGLKKGDKVYKDKEELLSDANLISILANGSNIDSDGYDKLEKVLESGLQKGFRKAKIKNSVSLHGFDYSREAYKNKLKGWN
jgi:tape measure domain-containing protein